MSALLELGIIVAGIIGDLMSDYNKDLKGLKDGTLEAQETLDRWRARRRSAVDEWRNRAGG